MNFFRVAILALAALLISGCSVKDNDSGLTKVAKQTVNAPIYAVLAVGMAGTMLGGGVGYAVSKTGDAIAGREWYLGEKFMGIASREALDANASLATFYEDKHFVLLKDSKNKDYLYLKDSNELIRTEAILNPKRWSTAGLEGRPMLSYFGVRLPPSITKEMIEEKADKDRFGNPVFIGEDSLVALRPRRDGWLMSLKYELFVLPDGANSFIESEKDAPKTLHEWLRVHFDEQMHESGELKPIKY